MDEDTSKLYSAEQLAECIDACYDREKIIAEAEHRVKTFNVSKKIIDEALQNLT